MTNISISETDTLNQTKLTNNLTYGPVSNSNPNCSCHACLVEHQLDRQEKRNLKQQALIEELKNENAKLDGRVNILKLLNSHLVGRVKELCPKFEAVSASEILEETRNASSHPWLTVQSWE